MEYADQHHEEMLGYLQDEMNTLQHPTSQLSIQKQQEIAKELEKAGDAYQQEADELDFISPNYNREIA
jgi:hypothetical protein